jgi:hypothetical protein
MDAFHVLLCRPWQYDRKIVHDGVKSTFMLENDGRKIRMLLVKEGKRDNNNNNNYISGRRVMLCSTKEF